jgi:hypothetical protein
MSVDDELGTLSGETSLSIRDVASRAGDVHAAMMRLLSELWGLSEDELLLRGEADLGKLRDRERLTDGELEQLLEILRLIRTEASPRDKSESIDAVRRQIEANAGSPVALTIAAIAVDSSRAAAERAAGVSAHLVAASEGAVVAADVVGGIGGAFAGDALCGALCAVMGGAAGAAGLSILAQEHL